RNGAAGGFARDDAEVLIEVVHETHQVIDGPRLPLALIDQCAECAEAILYDIAGEIRGQRVRHLLRRAEDALQALLELSDAILGTRNQPRTAVCLIERRLPRNLLQEQQQR